MMFIALEKSHKKKWWILLTFLCYPILTGIFYDCNAQTSNRILTNEGIVPHLFVYSREQMMTFLKTQNLTNSFTVRRNTAGDKLIFFSSSNDGNKKVVILSVKNGVKVLIPPARVSYLGEDEKFIAWTNDLEKGVHFTDGSHLELSRFAPFQMDSSGAFFFKTTPNGTEVRSTNAPSKMLLNSQYFADNIFYKGDQIYLMSSNIIKKSFSIQFEIVCQIYRREESQFKIFEEIHITRPTPGASPFWVEDMDPWSDNLLIRDVCDCGNDDWFLFNITTNELKKIGQAKTCRGFFLKEDILGQINCE